MFPKYYCEMTEFLDTKIVSSAHTTDVEYSWKHYLMLVKQPLDKDVVFIRVSGCTVGSITIDSNRLITSVSIDNSCISTKYPLDINDNLKKFIGVKLEID